MEIINGYNGTGIAIGSCFLFYSWAEDLVA